MKYRTAYDLMREKTRDANRRLSRMTPPKAAPVLQSVARRAAALVPFTPKAISILAPAPETAETIRRFVAEQFQEAQAKKKAFAR